MSEVKAVPGVEVEGQRHSRESKPDIDVSGLIDDVRKTSARRLLSPDGMELGAKLAKNAEESDRLKKIVGKLPDRYGRGNNGVEL